MYENVLETLSVVEKTGSDFNPVTTSTPAMTSRKLAPLREGGSPR